MINVAEAKAIIAENVVDFGVESVPLNAALGRILREEISTDRDMPPYDRVTMDGIAVSLDSFQKGQRSFPVKGVAAAGTPQQTIEDPTVCIEIMTGAIMPNGLDTVIPYEKIEIKDSIAYVGESEEIKKQNVHYQGQDRKSGDVILLPGTKISSVDIGACATVGKTRVKVSKLPKCLVISSGDELVEIDKTPKAHQIRKSNVYRISTVLSSYGIPIETAHFKDDMDEIVKDLSAQVKSHDVILLSGGVSKGKFDYLPEALEKVGVKKLFHRIAQRPGKPFWFGRHPQGAIVFAFPGNPVSSFMCMQNYFKEWLNACMQWRDPLKAYAKLTREVVFKPGLTYYLEVKLSFNGKAELMADPIKGNGSGDLANLLDADAFIELPRGKDVFEAGEVYPILRYRETSF